jgi:hypothetical protein
MTEEQIRFMALQLADKRMPSDATNDDLVKEADKLVAFIKAGANIAVK